MVCWDHPMPKKAQDAAHGKKNQRQGNPWVETVHADLDGWVQARTRLSLWRNTEGRFPCLPSGLAWGWWYGSFPAMSSQVGIPLPASRGVPTSLDVVSHILHHRKSLSPPSPSPAPGSLPKFPSPPSPPPHLPAPPPRRCYGAGQNEGTMGQQKEEVHQPSGPLRTKRVAQAPHHQHQWVCACPSWWGVSSPTLLVAPTQRGKAVLGCLSRFLWGRSFFGDPLWLSEAALSFTSIFPCCSHFCCSPSPFYHSLRR